MINKTIGNTPTIKIKYKYNDKIKYIYVKLEYYNLSGSIKDRVAYYMIKRAKERKELMSNQPIIEVTSGNTGIAISALAALEKHPVYIFMPDSVSAERVKLMEGYGAHVTLVSKEEGGFLKCLEKSKQLAKEINGFLTKQFSNQDNYLAHYETTAVEILNTIKEPIGGFISGVGTGGTLMGIGERLKKEYNNLLITAIEPHLMPIISNGKILGDHKIEGIGDEFVPDLIKKDKIDKIYLVNDEDAINMSRKLASNLGLGVGISSGANLIGSILLNEEINESVVTVFADDNKKYLSTSLSEPIKDNKEYISNKIELLDYEVL